MRRLTSTHADFILQVSPDGRLLAASGTIDHLLGWDLARCASDSICVELDDGAQRAAVRQPLAQTLSTGSARTTLQLSGELGPVRVVSARHLVDQPGRPVDARRHPAPLRVAGGAGCGRAGRRAAHRHDQPRLRHPCPLLRDRPPRGHDGVRRAAGVNRRVALRRRFPARAAHPPGLPARRARAAAPALRPAAAAGQWLSMRAPCTHSLLTGTTTGRTTTWCSAG